jgi:hypothetical protein
MKPSNPLHPYYISDHELTAEAKIRLREISSRKKANFKIAIASIIAAIITVLGAFTIRHFELKYIKNNDNCKGVSIETILNIQDLMHKLDTIYNYEKSSANHCKIAMSKINDLHRAKYPQQYYSQFGYDKGKK